MATSTTSATAASFSATYSKDLATAKSLGTSLEKADNAYQKAMASGDNKVIGPAQIEYNKAQEQFMSFITSKNKEHDMIMQLIAMIGR